MRSSFVVCSLFVVLCSLNNSYCLAKDSYFERADDISRLRELDVRYMDVSKKVISYYRWNKMDINELFDIYGSETILHYIYTKVSKMKESIFDIFIPRNTNCYEGGLYRIFRDIDKLPIELYDNVHDIEKFLMTCMLQSMKNFDLEHTKNFIEKIDDIYNYCFAIKNSEIKNNVMSVGEVMRYSIDSTKYFLLNLRIMLESSMK